MPPLTPRELWEMFPAWARASFLFAIVVMACMLGIAIFSNASYPHLKQIHAPIPREKAP